MCDCGGSRRPEGEPSRLVQPCRVPGAMKARRYLLGHTSLQEIAWPLLCLSLTGCWCAQSKWDSPLWGSIERMGLNPKKEATYAILGITGTRKDKSINREEAGVIQMAWRTLYAQTVKTKLEGGHLTLLPTHFQGVFGACSSAPV